MYISGFFKETRHNAFVDKTHISMLSNMIFQQMKTLRMLDTVLVEFIYTKKSPSMVFISFTHSTSYLPFTFKSSWCLFHIIDILHCTTLPIILSGRFNKRHFMIICRLRPRHSITLHHITCCFIRYTQSLFHFI